MAEVDDTLGIELTGVLDDASAPALGRSVEGVGEQPAGHRLVGAFGIEVVQGVDGHIAAEQLVVVGAVRVGGKEVAHRLLVVGDHVRPEDAAGALAGGQAGGPRGGLGIGLKLGEEGVRLGRAEHQMACQHRVHLARLVVLQGDVAEQVQVAAVGGQALIGERHRGLELVLVEPLVHGVLDEPLELDHLPGHVGQLVGPGAVGHVDGEVRHPVVLG